MSDTNPAAKEWLSPEEVSEWLGIPKREVLELFRAGRIPGVKLSRKRIRFRRSDLEEVLAALTEGKARR
jgi:excisionase family DNA binding protein